MSFSLISAGHCGSRSLSLFAAILFATSISVNAQKLQLPALPTLETTQIGAPSEPRGIQPFRAAQVSLPMMTRTAPAACDPNAPPVAATTFLTTDTQAILWFYATSLNVGDVFASEYYTPAGQFYAPASGPWDPRTTANNSCYTDSPLKIAGAQPATLVGMWSVKVKLNGAVVSTLQFQIAAPSATPPISANSVWYQPTPYDVALATGIQHIWDGWITSVYYGKVLIRDEKLQVGGYADEYRSYLKFDTTGLPKTVTRAVLNLMPYSRGDDSTPVAAKISSVTGNWSPALVWDAQPPAALIANLARPTIGQWWTSTITDTFNAWQTGANYGVVIAPLANANNFDMLRSSRYSDDAQRPALSLEFTPPVPTPAFKMPLPGGVSWLVTTEAGGYDCTGKGLQPDTGHAGLNYFAIDFSWRNKDSNGNQTYSNPATGGSIPIIAAAAGKIVATSVTNPIPDNGNYVVISHDDGGNAATGFSTRYLHMRDIPLVAIGQSVQQGGQLGWMGTTGNSTAPHLHFGVRYNDDGSSTRAEVTYVTIDGWLLKGFQTECAASGDYIRYYASSSSIPQAPSPASGVPAISAVSNAFGDSQAIAPNTWVMIKGSSLAPAGKSRIWQDSDFVNNQMPTELDGVSVTVNGKRAFVYYISAAQINILTPPDPISGPVQVQVANNGATSAFVSILELQYSPSFFVLNGGHYVTGLHADGSLIGPASLYPGLTTPAKAGETVTLYGNGFGPTSPPVVSGSPSQSGVLPTMPLITIGGVAATVQFAGLVSPGLYQMNVVVPAEMSGGDKAITATYGGFGVQAGVLLPIQASAAPPPTVSALSLTRTSVTGPNIVLAQVSISSLAPSGGVDVQLSSSNSAFQVPTTLRIAQGLNLGNFYVTVSAVATIQTATITARLNGSQQTAALTVVPAVPSNPFKDYEITIQAPLTFAGKQVSTKFTVGAMGTGMALVDTTADFMTGILLNAYCTQPTLSGNSVMFSQVTGSYNNVLGSGSGSISSGSLSITAATADVGATVTGTFAFSVGAATFTNIFTGRITSSSRLF